MRKILITAANGNTGFPAAKELLKLGFQVKAFVRNTENPKALELKQLGAELFQGDIEDIRDVRKALEGIDRAYFIPTYPNVLYQGSTFAVALREVNLDHVVIMTQWLSSNTHPSIYTKEHWILDQLFKYLMRDKYTILNPGLFASSYFMDLEPIAQFGILPDFGPNAPPSNEDIGRVAAHILKSPVKHIGKTYRITGPKVLSSNEMAQIFTKVLRRKVKPRKMSEKIMNKSFRAGKFLVKDFAQLVHYVRDSQLNTFTVGGPTSVVKDITGIEAEDFETIAYRYTEGNPVAKPSFKNKMRAIYNMFRVLFTKPWNLKKFEAEQGFPSFNDMKPSIESSEWNSNHPNYLTEELPLLTN